MENAFSQKLDFFLFCCRSTGIVPLFFNAPPVFFEYLNAPKGHSKIKLPLLKNIEFWLLDVGCGSFHLLVFCIRFDSA